MLRAPAIGALLFLACARCAIPANPDDIQFTVTLLNDSRSFHMGERIKLELSYSSDSQKKYMGSFSSNLGGVTAHILPQEGVLNLEDLRRGGVVAMSVLSGSSYLSPQPYTQKFDLADSYRFEKPGRYSIAIYATNVSHIKAKEEGGGFEQITLESDPIEFEILPDDPSWNATELEEIQQALAASENDISRQISLDRLEYLDTPASVEALLHLYLTKSDPSGWVSIQGLRESSHGDQIIRSLQTALSDPSLDVPSGLPDLLAEIQVQRKLGPVPVYPADPGQQDAWKKENDSRTELTEKYLAQANAMLLASLAHRSGALRSRAIYDAWDDAERLNAGKPSPSESLLHLRQAVLDVANDLDSNETFQILSSEWATMPHDQLLPIILALTQNPSNGNPEPFERWCEGWPSDCSSAILDAVLHSSNAVLPGISVLLQESEHQELDVFLQSKLKDPATLRDPSLAYQDSAVIFRAGSRNLRPAVDLFLDQFSWKGAYGCDIRGYLIGYLLRFNPADGQKRLAAAFTDAKDDCGVQMLNVLDNPRFSASVLPVARGSLDSPNPLCAGAAAMYLAKHGPASDEQVLWQRLNAFWKEWHDRASLLQSVVPYGAEAPALAAVLEEELASSFKNATNWRLSPDEIDQLHSGCITQSCRDVAESKLSTSF